MVLLPILTRIYRHASPALALHAFWIFLLSISVPSCPSTKQVCELKKTKMELESAIERSKPYKIYKALYKTLLSADSVDDFFVSARVPLEADIANDPIMRRRVEEGLKIDRICTRWIAIGWTLAFVWIAFGFTLTTILPFAWSILLNYVLPALGMIVNVTFYAFVRCFLSVPNRPNPDISNQTIINGLEDCNVTIGNFEWTVIMTSVNDQCSGVLIHPNYVLTAGKLQHNHYISLKLNIIFLQIQ